MKHQQTREFYHFGAFRLDAEERRLWCEDELILLTPKEFDLLFYFVEHAGSATKKDELLDAVWADAYVEESTLARNISWLRKKLRKGAGSKQIIETVPKLGYRFAAEVTRSDEDEDVIIIEEQTVQRFRGEDIVTFDEYADGRIGEKEIKKFEGENANFLPENILMRLHQSFSAPIFLLIALGLTVAAGIGIVYYPKNPEPVEQSAFLNIESKKTIKNIKAAANHQVVDAGITVQPGDITALYGETPIRIGSVINLKNQHSGEAGYLDAWGLVKSEQEFSIVPTELMFVSTHKNPNRNNGSGSWKIVSATGKKEGETLVYGDKIHLKNMYPGAGYLDNCGWLKDMPVFEDFVKDEKFAVFTTYSEDRDNGTGTWIISSNAKFDGNPVFEREGISLENGFSGGGFLDTAGNVKNIPAFNDYDGSLLVFIHESSTNRRPNSAIWIISCDNAAFDY